MPDGGVGIGDPITKVVATAFNLTIGLSDGRQITFQSGFEGDEPNAVVNARLDRMMAMADRQKARYDLPEAEEELAKQRETLANLLEDIPHVEKRHELEQAGRREQIAELNRLCEADVAKARQDVDNRILDLQAAKKTAFDAGQDDHQKRGRVGAYVPRGADKANADRLDSGIKELGEARDKMVSEVRAEYDRQIQVVEREVVKWDNERAHAREMQEKNLERWQRAVGETEARIGRLKASLGG